MYIVYTWRLLKVSPLWPNKGQVRRVGSRQPALALGRSFSEVNLLKGVATQRAQTGLIKEYALTYMGISSMI